MLKTGGLCFLIAVAFASIFFDLVDDDTVSCVERARRNGDEIV